MPTQYCHFSDTLVVPSRSLLLSLTLRLTPRSTLFPYTTLFRSLRIIAALSNEPGLLEAFRTNADVHTTTAAKVFNVFRSEEHTSELQSRGHLVCRLLLEKKKPREE